MEGAVVRAGVGAAVLGATVSGGTTAEAPVGDAVEDTVDDGSSSSRPNAIAKAPTARSTTVGTIHQMVDRRPLGTEAGLGGG